MPKLTKRTVEAAPSDPTPQVFLWDSELPGFGLRLFATGKPGYLVQYRVVAGRTRRLALALTGF